ncbi:MAG: hypothetical protein EOL97_06665 [Spirochaetia bacterium]|nr:hypothetical protein [Spirochaetia bacterium]
MLFTALAVGVGVAKGAMNWYTQDQKRLEKIDEYDSQLKKIDLDKEIYKSGLDMDLNSNLTNLNNQIEATSINIEKTQDNQKTSLASGARTASDNSRIMNIEYATLIDSVKQNSGKAISSASNSGFRMSESANNLKKIAEKEGSSAISKFKIKSDLENYGSYESVRQQYENYNNQIESYQFNKSILSEQINTEEENYKTKLNNYEKGYNFNKSYITDQVNYLKTDGKTLTNLGGFVGLFSDAFSSYAPYYKPKKNV